MQRRVFVFSLRHLKRYYEATHLSSWKKRKDAAAARLQLDELNKCTDCHGVSVDPTMGLMQHLQRSCSKNRSPALSVPAAEYE